MKRVAFIHATMKVKNSVHKKSPVLETVPVGWLSRSRVRDASRTETVIESVIRDVAGVRLLDEIVVVTSFDACDDQIAAIAAQCDAGMKVSCYRVDDNEPYAITEQNKSANGHEWPYRRFPVYGAWHVDGLLALAKIYAADVAFVLQADAMFLNVAMCEELLAKYAQKGVWIKDRIDEAYVCAIINVQFMAELVRKHRTRIESVVQKSRERFSYRLYNVLGFHMEDTGRADFVLPLFKEQMPFAVLYDDAELRMVRACAQTDVAAIGSLLSDGKYAGNGRGPAFVEIDLIDAQQAVMPHGMVERLLSEADHFGSVINVRMSSWNKEACRQFSNVAAAGTSSFLMAELDDRAIAGIDDESRNMLVKKVALIQLNVTAETDPSRIMPFCEHRMNGGTGACFIVLCVRPHDVEKFYSFSQMIDRFVIKSAGGVKHEMDMIDFSPLERRACKKLPTSLFIGSDGAHAPCRFMRTVGSAAMHDLSEAFRSPEMVAIVNDHVAGRYQAHRACGDCREWFIADVVSLPRSFAWVQALSCMTIPATIAASVDALAVFAGELSQLRRTMIAYDEQVPSHSMTYAFYTGLHGIMIEVGDRLCALGAVEKALDIWEEVLRYDPSNAKIHGELNRLLAESKLADC